MRLILLFLFSILQESKQGDAPEILEHPLDSIVLRDDPVTMKCRASGTGVTYTWYKNGSVLVNDKNSLVLKDGSLFLIHAAGDVTGKDADNGNYYCNASNEYGYAISNTATVRIAMLKKEFRANPQSTQAVVGSRVTLSCLPPRGLPEPVVSWQKGNNTISIQEDGRLSIHPAGDLVIENVQRSDSASYKCVATNMVGTVVSNPANLIVQERPVFTKKPENQTVQEGASVHFHCEATGEPLPKISWRKQKGQMPVGRAELKPGSDDPRFSSQTLSIKKIRPSDAGIYICQGKSSAGSIDSVVRLTVLMSPELSKIPQNLNVNSGQTAEFECEAEGDPKPGIVWTKQSDPTFTKYAGFSDQNDRIYATESGHLIVKNARPSDTGTYTCAAINSITSVFRQAILLVTDKPGTNIFPPPIIEHGPQNQTLMLNDMAMLPCKVIGRITPEVTWLHDGKLIDFDESNSRFELLSTGALRITRLKKSDSGVYTCKAQNNDGQVTWTAGLSVEDHTNPSAVFHRMDDISKFPSAPGKPNVINVSTDTVELEWLPPEKSGMSTIIGYLIQYWSPEIGDTWYNVLEVVSGTRFTVKNLRPGFTYIFLVRAENRQGIGPPSEPTEAIVMLSDFKSGIESSSDQAWSRLSEKQLVKLTMVQALNSSTIELKWELEHFEPLIDGYYIKWRGPPLANNYQNWINVTNGRQTSYIVGDLKPFTYYEFFLVPYHNNIPGKLSNSIGATTMEAAPSMPPTNVKVRMTAMNTLHVMWKPPPQEAINGVLKGFRVTVSSNLPDHPVRNITTNERANSITLFNLVRDATYRIKLAAENSAGIGEYHVSDPIVINNATLQRHLKIAAEELEKIRNSNSFLERNKLVIGALVCSMLAIVAVSIFLFCFVQRCRHRNEKGDGSAVLYNQSQQPFNDNYTAYHAPQMFLDARSFPSPHVYPNRQNAGFQSTLPHMPNQNYHFSPPESAYSQIIDSGSNYYGHQGDDGPLYSVGYCAMNDPENQPKAPPIPAYPPPPLNHYSSQKLHSDARKRLGSSTDRHLNIHGSYNDGHEMVERNGNFYSARTGINTSGSQKSDSPHTEISILNSYNSNGRKARTLNRSSPPRNILDFVPPPPPVDDRGYKTAGYAHDFQRNGKIYMQPSEAQIRNEYIPIDDEAEFKNAHIRTIRNRSRQGYAENGRRSQNTDDGISPRSSLINAADEEDDIHDPYISERRGIEPFDSMEELPQHTNIKQDIDSAQHRRGLPVMGRRAVQSNTSSHDISLPRRSSALVHNVAD